MSTPSQSQSLAKAKGQQPPATPSPSSSSSSENGRLSSLVAASIPALQFQAFYFLFPQLVDDPVGAMSTSLLAATAVLQVGSALAFLPVAGTPKPGARKLRPGEKKKSGAGGGPNIVIATFLSLLLTLIATPALYATMVLFGAPFLTHVSHTFLCALHLSFLGLFPLFYTRGLDAEAWRQLAGMQSPVDENVGGLAGALLGAWLGAVPIPLDWDRDWQRWPVTVLAGVYAGWAVGSYAGRTVLKGRKF